MAVDVEDLERRWKHACDIAAISIGHPDRAANIAYREELAAQLREVRAAAGVDG